MRVWISKYALTEGVFSVEGEPNDVIGKGSFLSEPPEDGCLCNGFGPGDWHNEKADAIARAEELRDLEIQRLNDMVF